MRSITTSDFETANVQYIEIWLMDPFVYDNRHKGGDVYFDLGNVSEDILKDGRTGYPSCGYHPLGTSAGCTVDNQWIR